MAYFKTYRKRLPTLLLLLAVLLTGIRSSSLAQHAEQPRKLAFIVGVSEYQKDGLTNLKYAHKDANDLSQELASQGFQVTKLIGRDAKHEVVLKKFATFIEATADLGKDDVVLVSFSGHGVQKHVKTDGKLVEAPFFCVYDTMVNKPSTMVSLNKVLGDLKEHSGSSSNLLLVDACRNNPDKGARTLDGSTVNDLPTKISMLFSSSPGQRSYESDKVQQGVFTHVLLKGLRGESANSRGQVKWASLATYVLEEVPLHVTDLLADPNIKQMPNLAGNFVRSPILVATAKVPVRSVPIREKKIAAPREASTPKKTTSSAFKNNIGMEFQLIPAGKFTMGSPKYEKERVEGEHQHLVEITRPFYMGTFEVTQAQWERVMGENPSVYSPEAKTLGKKWREKAKERVAGMNTDSFPVENVAWVHVIQFIDRLNSDFSVKGYKYRLPTEAEWEYACRGGSRTAFHFGDVLTGKEANCRGTTPYNSRKKGPNLERPTHVGSYPANSFGLHDMSGNVSEWCSDFFAIPYYKTSPRRDPAGPKTGQDRVERGGSWSCPAGWCRSARRGWYHPLGVSLYGPPEGNDSIGFRVVLVR